MVFLSICVAACLPPLHGARVLGTQVLNYLTNMLVLLVPSAGCENLGLSVHRVSHFRGLQKKAEKRASLAEAFYSIKDICRGHAAAMSKMLARGASQRPKTREGHASGAMRGHAW